MYILRSGSLQKAVGISFAIALIAILNPFFLWDGYRGGIFSSSGIPVLKLIYVFVIIIGSAYVAINRKVERKNFYIFLFLVFNLIVIEFICGCRFSDLSSITLVSILNFFVIGLFCLFPDNVKANIYRWFLFMFVISIIPGIIYSIFTFAGINLSFETITASSEIKQNSYVQYLHFPFAVQISKNYDLIGNLNRFRLCGIYDEPGRVGTVCALLLTTEGLKIKKDWKNLLLFIGGVLSLSLAFFLIIAIVFIYKMFKKNEAKYAVFLIVILVAFFVFLNIDFDNVALASLQNRFVITSTGLAGNNRTGTEFNNIFYKFLENSGIFTLLLGNGDGSMYKVLSAASIGYGSSYKSIIYDIGFLGTILYILWIVMYGKKYWSNKKMINSFIVINIAIFIINLYQRPSIFHPSYLLILLGGIANVSVLSASGENKLVEDLYGE